MSLQQFSSMYIMYSDTLYCGTGRMSVVASAASWDWQHVGTGDNMDDWVLEGDDGSNVGPMPKLKSLSKHCLE